MNGTALRWLDRHEAHELDFWFGTRILGWVRAVDVMDKELNAVPIWVGRDTLSNRDAPFVDETFLGQRRESGRPKF